MELALCTATVYLLHRCVTPPLHHCAAVLHGATHGRGVWKAMTPPKAMVRKMMEILLWMAAMSSPGILKYTAPLQRKSGKDRKKQRQC